MSKANKSMSKSIEEKYVQLSDIEHVLKNPGMYIGETQLITDKVWIYVEKFEKKEIEYSPGLYKIFDEILVNALDHYTRSKAVTQIKVEIKNGKIAVYNDGPGIEVEIHKETGLYVPEMIFGTLKTSSNYDSNEEKIVGGKHGLGAKLTAIFSKSFKIETIDTERKKKYSQTFENNLSKKNKPKITNLDDDDKAVKEPYTKIVFEPDLEKFGLSEMTEDIISHFYKRVIDIAANTPKDVSVSFNGKKIPIRTFDKYCNMYLEDLNETEEKPEFVYSAVNDRWEVAVAPLPEKLSGFEAISFVNGINTSRGGKHVDYIVEQLIEKLTDAIKKKKKDAIVKPNTIKQNLFIFIKSFIVNPNFDSQTKETLTSPVKKFGSDCVLPDAFIKKFLKTAVFERVMSTLEVSENKELSKTDGTKKKRLTGIAKLDDANKAGTKDSIKCTLILTEGDSAKSMALSGLSAIKDGRDYYGIFPLRGKLINVREASLDQVRNNQEINNMKQILGLQTGHEYKSRDELRYGSVMIMTDQDHDGSHIKGLLMNFFDHYFPSLVKLDGFLKEFRTPIVKATKGKDVKIFYTLTEYDTWKETSPSGYYIKYYKGLGTSDAKEAKEYFSKVNETERCYDADKCYKDAIELAFKKDMADDRKTWLSSYDKNEILDTKEKKITITDFVHRELKHFSNYDNIRSIPRLEDGLKPSLRKIVYATLLRKWSNDIKVAQFAGFVSEKTSYHHGEASLNEAIVGLAQDFVGSNNVNLLKPNGQFGTRILGGKDSASPRYIFTQPMKYFDNLFHQDDLPLMNYQDDDGTPIEPEFYMPIVPLLLINGSEGIGTGWSSYIPAHNPVDIISNLRDLMENPELTADELPALVPWYRGFTGDITQEDGNTGRYICRGSYSVQELTNTVKISITELPVGVWTEKFKELLEGYIIENKKESKGKYITGYDNLSTDTGVKFVITMPKDKWQDFGVSETGSKQSDKNSFVKRFKLEDVIGTTNMVLYNTTGQITRYKSTNDILVEYFHKRLEYYQKRKDHILEKLANLLKEASAKARFIQEIIDGKLVVYKRAKIDICKDLKKSKYPTQAELGKVISQSDDENVKNGDYDYLISMPIYSFTKERIEKLKKEVTHYEEQINELEGKTKVNLWEEDLEKLEKVW